MFKKQLIRNKIIIGPLFLGAFLSRGSSPQSADRVPGPHPVPAVRAAEQRPLQAGSVLCPGRLRHQRRPPR